MRKQGLGKKSKRKERLFAGEFRGSGMWEQDKGRKPLSGGGKGIGAGGVSW